MRHDLWGRLATCGGLVTRLPAFPNGRPAPVANRRAGYHPAPQSGGAATKKNVPEARKGERDSPRARALGPYSEFASPGTGRKRHSSPVLSPRSGARLPFTPFPVLTHWATI